MLRRAVMLRRPLHLLRQETAQPLNTTPPTFGQRFRESVKKRGFRGVLTAVIGAYFITNTIIQYRRQVIHDRIHDDTILHWKISPGSITEGPADTAPFQSLANVGMAERGAKPLSLLQIVRALELASKDDRITGLVARFTAGVPGPPASTHALGLAQAQELHNAIEEFKKAKIAKFGPEKVKVVAYTESFDNQLHYYLATAFDKIYMQPTGSLGLVGLSTTVPFFKLLLDKLGIKIHAETRNEYKSVASMATETKWPEKQKQNMIDLMANLNDQFVEVIARARTRLLPDEENLEQRIQKVKELMSLGSLSAEEAHQHGLIDGRTYRHNVSALVGRNPAKALPHYLRVREAKRMKEIKNKPKVTVGLVYLLGNIIRSGGQYNAQKVTKAILDAAMDPHVDSILLRIDSGGGDVVASDTIWEAVRRVQILQRKPVIVSFANKSASGGYYVSTFCDAIIANPATITGSIGVAAVRPIITQKFLDTLNLSIDDIHLGPGTKINSPFYEMTKDELKRYKKRIDEMYHDFLIRVSKGRRIPMAELDEIAGGRVYTGEQAKAINLVDKLGGLTDAIDIAAQHAFTRREHLIQAIKGIMMAPGKPVVVKLEELGQHHEEIREYELHSRSHGTSKSEQTKPDEIKTKIENDKDNENVKDESKNHVIELLPVPEDYEIIVKVFPKRKSFFEMLSEAQFMEDYSDIFWMTIRDQLFKPITSFFVSQFKQEFKELIQSGEIKNIVAEAIEEIKIENEGLNGDIDIVV